jgi:cysteine desulfurase
MGVSQEFAVGTVRFSVGRFTTPEEIRRAVDEVAGAIDRLRAG